MPAAPAWSALSGSKSIVFAVNGPLARIPLGVLARPQSGGVADAAWLLRDAAVTQVSSVAAFQALRGTAKRDAPQRPFAGFGDPQFGPGIPALPETRREILALARSFGADPQQDAYLGARATRRAALSNDLSSRRVVAFATHGLKPGDVAGLSRPALAMSQVAGDDQSAFLLLDDVMTMKLNADLVVLSACNTASEDGRAEEALSGLARGFFYAGARSVLATHWAVESLSSEQVVTRTFAHYVKEPAIGRAEALRRAQLELADGNAGASFRHPFFWSAFTLTGDPAR
jgi:CHAT domain-containing protein